MLESLGNHTGTPLRDQLTQDSRGKTALERESLILRFSSLSSLRGCLVCVNWVSAEAQHYCLITDVLCGLESTDDDKIVQYHWEELKGPLREVKISEDTAILKLSKLIPGNYTFR